MCQLFTSHSRPPILVLVNQYSRTWNLHQMYMCPKTDMPQLQSLFYPSYLFLDWSIITMHRGHNPWVCTLEHLSCHSDLMTKSRHITQTELADGDMHSSIASQLSRGHVAWLLSLHSWTSVAQLLRWHSEACILSLLTPWFRTCMPHLLNLHSWARITPSQNPQFRTYACHCYCCC